MIVAFEASAFDEYRGWRTVNAKIVDRIDSLIQSIVREGAMSGIGKPEKLKRRSGVYSRRIDDTNRLVYRYSQEMLLVVACHGHYA